jgi:hypothetical protein
MAEQKTEKKPAQKEEEEEEHGTSNTGYAPSSCLRTLLIIHRRCLFRLRVRQRIAAPASHTDRHSPVIVAEKMIGVAMYELVRDQTGQHNARR